MSDPDLLGQWCENTMTILSEIPVNQAIWSVVEKGGDKSCFVEAWSQLWAKDCDSPESTPGLTRKEQQLFPVSLFIAAV